MFKGFAPEWIALMAMALFAYKKDVELATALIFCVSRYSRETVRKMMVKMADKTYASK